MPRLILLMFVFVFTLPAHAANKILVVVAMEQEALPIIKALHLQPSTHMFGSLPMRGYEGKYQQKNVYLILNGQDPMYKVQNVGTQAATLTTYVGIAYFQPDLVISIGSAGGVEKLGAKLRDIYVSNMIYFSDRIIPGDGYAEYGVGGYPSAKLNLTKSDLIEGAVCSSDSFNISAAQQTIINKKRCAALDMEAAGVAWVSMLNHTPMVAVKGITNIIEHANGHDEYEKNLPVVTKSLADKLKEILNQLT